MMGTMYHEDSDRMNADHKSDYELANDKKYRKSNSQMTLHNSHWCVSYGVSIVNILKKIDHVSALCL